MIALVMNYYFHKKIFCGRNTHSSTTKNTKKNISAGVFDSINDTDGFIV